MLKRGEKHRIFIAIDFCTSTKGERTKRHCLENDNNPSVPFIIFILVGTVRLKYSRCSLTELADI